MKELPKTNTLAYLYVWQCNVSNRCYNTRLIILRSRVRIPPLAQKDRENSRKLGILRLSK